MHLRKIKITRSIGITTLYINRLRDIGRVIVVVEVAEQNGSDDIKEGFTWGLFLITKLTRFLLWCLIRSILLFTSASPPLLFGRMVLTGDCPLAWLERLWQVLNAPTERSGSRSAYRE